MLAQLVSVFFFLPQLLRVLLFELLLQHPLQGRQGIAHSTNPEHNAIVHIRSFRSTGQLSSYLDQMDLASLL